MPQPLGQHFLKNQKAITRIIDALNLQKGETVIEIGPGLGALTIPLVAECDRLDCKLIVIEKDAELAGELVSSLVGKSVQIIAGDALLELPKLTNQLTKQLTNYSLVGNIPYYITGALLRTIGELPIKPRKTVLMIQKEVAQRLCATPPKMNLLAAATQIWAEPKILFELPPTDFDPPPKVWSAVIQLIPLAGSNPSSPSILLDYYRALHIIFKQPRKTLLNNLSEEIGREQAQKIMPGLALEPNIRPQNLSIEQIIEISRLLG